MPGSTGFPGAPAPAALAAQVAKSLTSDFSGGGQCFSFHGGTIGNARYADPGAMTAGVYKTVVSVSGAGALGFLSGFSGGDTAKTITLRVTRDGGAPLIFSSSSMWISYCFAAIGTISSVLDPASGSSSLVAIPYRLFFNRSLLVEIMSSITGSEAKAQYILETY